MGETGTTRQPEDVDAEAGNVVTDGMFSEASGTASTVDTPTAAPAADQPTNLSSPLVPLSLTPQAPYHLAHTSNTTSTIRFAA